MAAAHGRSGRRASRAAADPPALTDCPHAERCPGCALIGRPLDEQLAVKAGRLSMAIAAYGIATPPEPVRPAEPTLAYRTRAKLAVAAGGRIGLFAAGSHEVIDLPQCLVLVPALAHAAGALRQLLAAPPPGTASLLRGVADDLEGAPGHAPEAGRLRAVDLREVVDDDGPGVLLTLVVDAPAPPPAELEAACDALAKAIPRLRVVALSLHDGRSPQLLGRAPVPLRGELLQRHRGSPDEPWSYASPGSFAQAHRAQAASIAREVATALSVAPQQHVLEVFAGSGALGLTLAARGARVTLVESFAPAAQAALQAAEAQSLGDRVRVCIGQAEHALPRLAAEGERFDAAVVNPPRRGMAPAAREAISRLCRGPLVYVSCEPETLARDLWHMASLGWGAARLVPFDLMPQTREVECVAVLERRAPPAPMVLYEDAELLAVDKPPFLATIPHRERDDSLLARVQALAPAAVALHRLDADTSGVCLFAKSAELAAAWQAALADAHAKKRYLALVRGRAREKGRIDRPIVEGGRKRAAVTRYRRRETAGGHTLLEVVLETGRTHQIRRHLASIDRPVLGDERYGHAASNRHLAERHWLDRPFLHCTSIALVHPRTQAPLQIESALAPDLATVLGRLRQAASRPPSHGSSERARSRKARAPRAKSSSRGSNDTTR